MVQSRIGGMGFLLGVVVFSAPAAKSLDVLQSGTPSSISDTRQVVSGSGGQFGFQIRANYVTSDGPGTHVTTPGVDEFGLDHDGVGDLLFSDTSGGVFRCSGSLIGDGQYILSAAHCFTDDFGTQTVTSASFALDTPSGTVVANASTIDIHPLWNGDFFNGHDVAVLTLDTPISLPGVPIYELNRIFGNEIGVESVKVGFGTSGDGITGGTIASGTKRIGLNEYEDDGLGTDPITGNTNGLGINNNDLVLTYDFDSNFANRNDLNGNDADHDAFDFFFGVSDLGFGDDEVGAAPGDSGGATFIDDNGNLVIAGITSYGLRLNDITDGSSSDVDGVLNSSWGEFGVDTRVSAPVILSFIDSIIPEPGTAGLVFVGGGLALFRRRSAHV
ncbi:MAG: trypsin-like serine protease [Planctomycetota bacterium]